MTALTLAVRVVLVVVLVAIALPVLAIVIGRSVEAARWARAHERRRAARPDRPTQRRTTP